MRALLIPVKDLRCAKQRLAPVFTQEERSGLALAMMEDVFATVRQTRCVDRVFLVTSYAPAIAVAEEAGWEVLRELQQVSESASVDNASLRCADRGVSALMRLPIDLPLVRPQDIEAIFSALDAAPCAVLVPSRDGTGTNAILRSPPALFPSHFGPNSFAKHLEEAQRSGACIRTLRNPRLELDVDDASDLRVLMTRDLRGTHTGRWLERNRIVASFLEGRLAAAGGRGGGQEPAQRG